MSKNSGNTNPTGAVAFSNISRYVPPKEVSMATTTPIGGQTLGNYITAVGASNGDAMCFYFDQASFAPVGQGWEILWTCNATGRYRISMEIARGLDRGQISLRIQTQTPGAPLTTFGTYDAYAAANQPNLFFNAWLWDSAFNTTMISAGTTHKIQLVVSGANGSATGNRFLWKNCYIALVQTT